MLHLGYWHIAAFSEEYHDDVAPMQVIMQVDLLNDGELTWPTGVALCDAQGSNGTLIVGRDVTALCGTPGRPFSPTCGALSPGESAQLVLTVQLPGPSQAVKGLRDERWALCHPTSGTPFGVLLIARVRLA